MKHSLHRSYLFNFFPLIIGFNLAVLISTIANSQTIPELVFKNPSLISGTALLDGAQYRFYNVGSGLDAILEIKNRSAANVVVNNIDITSTGWDKSLQPEAGISGTVAANQNWWVRFHLTFYNAGTMQKKAVNQFAITSLDMDGNGGSLREWIEMDKVTSIAFSQVNNLTDNLLNTVVDFVNLDNNGQDHKVTGVNVDYPGIDTASTNIMASYNFNNKSQFDFYLGGKTGASSNSSAMRMNSLWFRQFNLNASTLPIKLVDFSAKYNKSNVTLSWKSSQEINFSHYELEYSTDGTKFSQTALVLGTAQNGGGADYSYVDYSVAGHKGLMYYRLKMVDIDGKLSYSSVRIIRLGEEKSITLNIYPNPVVSDLRISLPSSWQGKVVTIDLYSVNGQKMKSLKTANSSQTENIPVADMGIGAYFVQVVCGTESSKQIFIKN